MTPPKAAVIMIQIELDPGLTGSGTGIGYSSGSYEAVTTLPVLALIISVVYVCASSKIVNFLKNICV